MVHWRRKWQYSCHKNLMDSMKRQKDVTPEDKLPRSEGVQRSWSWPVVWKPTRPSRTNTKNICPFHYRGLECKSRKSRNTGVTGKSDLGVQNEAGQRLIEFCQENALVIANTLFQQHKRRLYTWTITRWSMSKSDWLYSFPLKMELYTVSKNKTGSWLAQIMNSLLQNSDLNRRN